MPEEGIETQELKEKLDESEEHAGEGRASAPWILWLSMSTAIIAVLAAIASLESGAFANDAIVQKNDAILHQSKADDAWSYFQAKGIKAALYEMQPDPKWHDAAEKEKKGQEELRAEAEKEQDVVKEMDEKSEHSLHVHHQFAKSVTISQVAIALAAIAALTRRKSMWWVSLAAGAAGAWFFILGFVAQ